MVVRQAREMTTRAPENGSAQLNNPRRLVFSSNHCVWIFSCSLRGPSVNFCFCIIMRAGFSIASLTLGVSLTHPGWAMRSLFGFSLANFLVCGVSCLKVPETIIVLWPWEWRSELRQRCTQPILSSFVHVQRQIWVDFDSFAVSWRVSHCAFMD